jgi:hypothetical protein
VTYSLSPCGLTAHSTIFSPLLMGDIHTNITLTQPPHIVRIPPFCPVTTYKFLARNMPRNQLPPIPRCLNQPFSSVSEATLPQKPHNRICTHFIGHCHVSQKGRLLAKCSHLDPAVTPLRRVKSIDCFNVIR